MPKTEYIEINSTNRDRNKYNIPSQFTIPYNRNNHTIRDPICESSPLITWTPSLIDLTGSIVENLSEDTTRFIVSSDKFLFDDENKVKDPYYYNISNFEIIDDDNEIGKIVETGLISKIEYINKYEKQPNEPNECHNYWVTPKNPIKSSLNKKKFKLTNPTKVENGIFYVPGNEERDNFYNEYILWNDSVTSNSDPTNKWRKINRYNGSSHQIGVNNPPPLWDPGHQYNIRKVNPVIIDNLNTYFSSVQNSIVPDNLLNSYIRDPTKEIFYKVENWLQTQTSIQNPEFLRFTVDNFIPLKYSGVLNQKNVLCHEIELINLIVPNKELKNGGRITQYSHLLVKLYDNNSNLRNNVYSNNSNIIKYLFKVSIDTSPNCITPFIKLDGNKQKYILRINPHSEINFGVYLPDGTPLETLESERFSPSEPNPHIQISATFSITKL